MGTQEQPVPVSGTGRGFRNPPDLDNPPQTQSSSRFSQGALLPTLAAPQISPDHSLCRPILPA